MHTSKRLTHAAMIFWSGFIMAAILPAIVQADDLCISSIAYNSTTGGSGIITAIFAAINAILTSIAATFFDGIITNPAFSPIVNALMILYLTMYGVMIMFNLASVQTGEITSRLIKIGIIYAVVSPGLFGGGTTSGWFYFYQWVGGFFMGGMNELIVQFSQAAVAGGPPVTINTSTQLSPTAMGSLFGPIGMVFSAKFMVALLALFAMGMYGWMIAIFLLWGLIEFIFMLIAAVSTYVKSMVGLAFLFGIAPIFFLFLLFEKTRSVFQGWLNQVLAFSLTPVLLFAFLAFYVQLISATLMSILNGIDFCYVVWFSFLGSLFDIYWWRPTVNGVAVSGDFGFNPPPINIVDVLYFLLLCHLGKAFGKFIEQISRDLSGGSGPGITRDTDIKNWFKNNLTGGRGTAGIVRGGLGSAMAAGKWGATKLGLMGSASTTVQRSGVGNAPSSSTGRQMAGGGVGVGVSGGGGAQDGVGALTGVGETHLDRAAKEGFLAQTRAPLGGGAAAAAAAAAASKKKGIRDAFGYRAGAVSEAIGKRTAPVSNAVSNVIQTGRNGISKSLDAISSVTVKPARNAINGTRNAVNNQVNHVKHAIHQQLDPVIAKVHGARDAVNEKIDAVHRAVDKGFDAMNEAYDRGVQPLRDAAHATKDGISKAMNDLDATVADVIAGDKDWRNKP